MARANENGAYPDEIEAAQDAAKAGELLSGLVVTEHQPSWEPSFEERKHTPPESPEDSDVDSEGRDWTRDKWLMKHDDLSNAAKHQKCLAEGWRPPGGKQPYKRPRDEEREKPDLAAYLDDFDIPKEQHVTLCRAYASYVAATLPKKVVQKKKGKQQ